MKNNYIKKTLKNGVKLYLYIDKNMRRTLVDYSINYGSCGCWYNFYLDEKLYHVLPGCAHFLEHMLGEHSKYGNLYKIFSDNKYERNASTSTMRTHYYFIGVENIKESIEKLIRSIDEPCFTDENVEATKPAIIEETKRSLNNKERISVALYARNLYKNLDLFHSTLSTIGNETTTKELNYGTLKLCYDAFYYDENKCLLIAGNFDENEMTSYIESIYETIKPHKKRVKEYDYGDLYPVKRRKDEFYMATNDEIVTIGFKQNNKKYTKKEIYYYTKFILSLKFGNETKFVERLKEKNVITKICDYDVFFLNDDYYDIYITSYIKNSDMFLKEVLKFINKKDFKEKDFNLFIKQELSSAALAIDSKYKRLLGFPFRNTYSDDFIDMDFLKTLTFNSFIEFYNTLDYSNYTVGIVKNEEML